jgi:hypothetical protein
MDIFASLAIRGPERAAMGAFHDFARAARSTDSAGLTALEAGLNDTPESPATLEAARALAAICAARGLSLDHARHVLQAARLDLERPGCRSWSDLLLRCRYGAAPIGRFALDLHGEDRALGPAADALCTALAIEEGLSRGPDIIPEDWRDRPDAVVRIRDGLARLADAARPLSHRARTKGVRIDAAAALDRLDRLGRLLADRSPPVSLPAWRATALWLAAWLRA